MLNGKEYKISLDAKFDLAQVGQPTDEAYCQKFEAEYRRQAKSYAVAHDVKIEVVKNGEQSDNGDEVEVWQAIHDLTEAPEPIRRYTCYVSVRGCCGHLHLTEDAAEACIARDSAACEKHGGYSDCTVYVIEAGSLSECKKRLAQTATRWTYEKRAE